MALVLTCCPPGPEEREKRQLSSDSGMETEPRTWIVAGMVPLSQMRSDLVAWITPGSRDCKYYYNAGHD